MDGGDFLAAHSHFTGAFAGDYVPHLDLIVSADTGEDASIVLPGHAQHVMRVALKRMKNLAISQI